MAPKESTELGAEHAGLKTIQDLATEVAPLGVRHKLPFADSIICTRTPSVNTML